MTDALLLQEPTPILDDTSNSEKVRHIIDQHKAGNLIADASIFGTQVIAMCGYKFIPTQDPDKFPTCQACKAALAALP